MVKLLKESSEPLAMMLMSRKLTGAAEKIQGQTTISVYFEFAVMKTGSEVLLIREG